MDMDILEIFAEVSLPDVDLLRVDSRPLEQPYWKRYKFPLEGSNYLLVVRCYTDREIDSTTEKLVERKLKHFVKETVNGDDELRHLLIGDRYLGMNYELKNIKTARGHQVPDGTEAKLSVGKTDGTVAVQLKLPGQSDWSDLGDLPIVDGAIELPIKLCFLSYAREDQKAVEQVAERLVSDGFMTWLDVKNLLPGDLWKDRIVDAIEQADHVLVFLSKASCNKKGFVQKEIKVALEQQELWPRGYRYIIPVLLESCEPPPQFSEINWLHFWKPDSYQRLLMALRTPLI